MKKIIFLTALLVIFVLPVASFALVDPSNPIPNDGKIRIATDGTTSSSSSSTETNSKLLTVTLKKDTQNIFTKSQPIFVDVLSQIDTDRLQISFTYDNKKLALNEKNDAFTSITKDALTRYVYSFTPLTEGTNKVVVKVQAWQNEANYPETETIDLVFDKNLEIVPQSDQYRTNFTIFQIVMFIVVMIVLVVAVFFGLRFGKRFIHWYERD
jgi:hypothetical protein